MWILAARMLGHPWTGPAIAPPVVEEFEERNRLYLQMTAGKKRGPSTPTNPRGAKATDAKATPARPMATANEPAQEGTPYQRQPPNPSPARPAKGRKGVSMAGPIHVITGSPALASVAQATNGPTAADHTNYQALATAYRDAAAAVPPPVDLTLTSEERFSRLIQVYWNRTPFRHISIFNTSIGFHWPGKAASTLSLTQVAYEAFKKFLKGAFAETKTGVVLLPFPDSRYQHQPNWIRTMQEFNESISTWEKLQLYIDGNFGNPYILDKADKIGNKVYKTRMRFGFDKDPDIVMRALKNLLNNQKGAGVFPTPIQRSHMTTIGFLPMYPAELNPIPINKDLMRLFDFRYPIGLMRDWVNSPRFYKAGKHNNNSRGMLLYHVCCDAENAKEIDRVLSTTLHQRQPKSNFPYTSPTH
jgi:hypothetical protein